MRKRIPTGLIPHDPSLPKDLIDFYLSRHPRLYRFVERHRRWLNWDKRLYLSLISPGDVVLDVGANVGGHTLFFSHLVGADGRVISFEPVPKNFDILRRTVQQRSRFANVTLIQAAAGNPGARGTTVRLTIPGDDSTQASMGFQHDGSWEKQSSFTVVDAALVSLDDAVAEHNLPRVDFVKIDVEGAELAVLVGGKGCVRQHMPLVYCEVFSGWTTTFGYTPSDLFSLLGSLGYTECRIIRGGQVIRLAVNDTVPVDLFSESSNVLFFSPNHTAAVARFDDAFSV